MARRLQDRCKSYVYYDAVFNHQDSVVDALIRQGLIDAKRPHGFRCPGCDRAKIERNTFNSKEREVQASPGKLCSIVEYDIYGPIDDGDPNGFRYLIVFICMSTGVVFAQPMRAKFEAKAAL